MAAFNIVGTLISCTLAAYAFARLRTRGSALLFGVLLSTTMLPAQVTVIPLFSWFASLGLIDTYVPLVLPAWLGTNVFACDENVPGVGTIHVQWQIIGPLAGAAPAQTTFIDLVAQPIAPSIGLRSRARFTSFRTDQGA